MSSARFWQDHIIQNECVTIVIWWICGVKDWWQCTYQLAPTYTFRGFQYYTQLVTTENSTKMKPINYVSTLLAIAINNSLEPNPNTYTGINQEISMVKY